MTFWYTTVLPALRQLELNQGVQRAFVVEDTCLLAAGDTAWVRDLGYALHNVPTAAWGEGPAGKWVAPGPEAALWRRVAAELPEEGALLAAVQALGRGGRR